MAWSAFLAEKGLLPDDYINELFKYNRLKTLLKQLLQPNSQASLLDQCTDTHGKFDVDAASNYLDGVSAATRQFFSALDEQVEICIQFYEKEQKRLQAVCSSLYSSQAEATNLGAWPKKVQALEKYILFCLISIEKLLKLYIKHRGVSSYVPEAYMLRVLRDVRLRSNLVAMDQLVFIKGSPASSGHATASTSPRKDTTCTLWMPFEARLGSRRVLITLTGANIMSDALKCLADANTELDDFSLMRMGNQVTIGMFIRPPSLYLQLDLAIALASVARSRGATLLYQIEPHGASSAFMKHSSQQKTTKYVTTILSWEGLTATHVSKVAQVLSRHEVNMERAHRQSGRDALIAIDCKLSIPPHANIDELRRELYDLSTELRVDIALQESNIFRQSKRLVVFDMDSTLIQQEVIDEIAKHAGVVEQVAKITESAMRGEIQFAESLSQRVALLKGTSVEVLEKVKQEITFTKGAHKLCRCLKRLGYKLAVISGGFMPLANHVKTELQLDYAFANNLKVGADGNFLGVTSGLIVTGERKADLLQAIAQAENIPLEQVAAVGDGANDLWMLATAGLGIAFNAKPKVQDQAQVRVNQKSLLGIMHLLGFNDSDIQELLA